MHCPECHHDLCRCGLDEGADRQLLTEAQLDELAFTAWSHERPSSFPTPRGQTLPVSEGLPRGVGRLVSA